MSVKDLMNPPRGNMHPVRRARLEGITGTPDERCQDGLQCLRRVCDRVQLGVDAARTGSVELVFSLGWILGHESTF